MSSERLQDLIARMKDAESYEEFHDIDTDFHIGIASASANALAPALMEALREAMSRNMLRGWESLPDWRAEQKRITAEHTKIARCIAAGDVDGAEAAMEKHITRFYRLLLDHSD